VQRLDFHSGQQPWQSSIKFGNRSQDPRQNLLPVARWLAGWLAGGSEMWIRPRPGNQFAFSAGCIEFFHLAVSEFSRFEHFESRSSVQGERLNPNQNPNPNPSTANCGPAFSYENRAKHIHQWLCLLSSCLARQ